MNTLYKKLIEISLLIPSYAYAQGGSFSSLPGIEAPPGQLGNNETVREVHTLSNYGIHTFATVLLLFFGFGACWMASKNEWGTATSRGVAFVGVFIVGILVQILI